MKLAGSFLVLVIILAMLAMFSIIESQRAMIDSVGTDSMHTAEFTAHALDVAIYQKYHELWSTGYDEQVQYFISTSNSEYDAMSDPQEYMDLIDSDWTDTPFDERTPFMEGIVANNVSVHLTETLTEHYLEEHGLSIYSRVALVNKYGAIISMTERTADFRQDDKVWWSQVVESGHYFGDAEVDPVTGTLGIRVCAKLIDPVGAFSGVIMAFLDLIAMAENSVYFVETYETTETHIVSSDGRLLFSNGVFQILEDVSHEDYYVGVTESSGYFIGYENDRERLFAYSHSLGYLRYDGGDWIIVVNHETSEVFADVRALTWKIVAVSVTSIGAAVVASGYFAVSLSRRIRVIAAAAGRFSVGDFGSSIESRSSDEIGELARSLNNMAGELQLLYGGLESKVQERTKELEQATKKLHLLGSITRHDALNQVTVILGWLEVIGETVDDKGTQERLKKIKEASLNLLKYMQFTGIYERVGTKRPEWIELGNAVSQSLFGLGPREFELRNVLSGVHVYGDLMLPKVFRNLADNSIAHGGEITSVSFTWREVPDGLLIVYEDDGVGIPGDMKEKIFGRIPKTGRKSLGLYLSREILSITGISIAETGEQGKGARFEMHVPEDHYRIGEAAPPAKEESETV